MFSERRRLPVFEEKDFHDILQKVGLLKKIEAGKLFCSKCEIKITKENFGALYIPKGSEDVAVVCNRSDCLRLIAEDIEL